MCRPRDPRALARPTVAEALDEAEACRDEGPASPVLALQPGCPALRSRREPEPLCPRQRARGHGGDGVRRGLSQHLHTLSGPLNLHASERKGRAWWEVEALGPLSPARGCLSALRLRGRFAAVESLPVSSKTRVDPSQMSLWSLKHNPSPPFS